MFDNLNVDIQLKIYKFIYDVIDHNKLRLTSKYIYNFYKNKEMKNIYQYNIYKEKFINVILIIADKYRDEPL
jgi:hypothetical protein